jgi:hypothetical protein
MDDVRACIDRVLPPDRLLDAADRAMAERASNAPLHAPDLPATAYEHFRLALEAGKEWPPGRTLRVRFLDGEEIIHHKVAGYAHQWSDHANITFEFGNDPEAEIRISFRERGSWSYLGTDAYGIDSHLPTMNYGWLRQDTTEEEYSRVVLHEFGHALGCIHEHQNPDVSIPWDRETVYAYYAGPPNNWSRNDVDRNLFEPYSRDRTQFSRFDPQSVMLYPIPQEHTVGDYSVGFNRELSETDRQFIGTIYPLSQRAVVRLEVDGPAAEGSIGAHRDEDEYEFALSQAGRYVIETHGPTDVQMGLFGPDSRTRLVAEDDDSGESLNARIEALLMAGRYFVRVRHSRPTGTGAYRIQVRTGE